MHVGALLCAPSLAWCSCIQKLSLQQRALTADLGECSCALDQKVPLIPIDFSGSQTDMDCDHIFIIVISILWEILTLSAPLCTLLLFGEIYCYSLKTITQRHYVSLWEDELIMEQYYLLVGFPTVAEIYPPFILKSVDF